MITANPVQAISAGSPAAEPAKFRCMVHSDEPEIFTDIYQEETNIAIWQRALSAELNGSVSDFLSLNSSYQSAMTVTPQSAYSCINESFGGSDQLKLSEDIAELVGMFCCLFELERAGLRLTALDRAMCPRFHVDRVPCRLITTYQGAATEWIPHQFVDRSNLGPASNNPSDKQVSQSENPDNIHQLNCGDVALLKGESWQGNENGGLVHRSPAIPAGENRLLLTLDFCN